MKKISIIVPVYNIEKYIEKCLKSIINQDYSNLEIIIVDDGSTDNSLKICQKYQKKDKRIKLIHQENKGLSGARNRGIIESSGEYIWFIDGDDYIEKDSIKQIARYINKYDIIVFNYKVIKNNKELKMKDNKKYDNSKTKYMLSYIMAWNKVFKRKILKEERFPEGYIHEDIYLIPTLGIKANKIIFIDDYLYNYVNRKNSITNGNYKLNDKLYALSNLEKRLMPKYKEEVEFIYINNLVLPSLVDKISKHHNYNLKQINEIIKKKFPNYYKNKYWCKNGLSRKFFLYYFYKGIYIIPLIITYIKSKVDNFKYKKIN